MTKFKRKPQISPPQTFSGYVPAHRVTEIYGAVTIEVPEAFDC